MRNFTVIKKCRNFFTSSSETPIIERPILKEKIIPLKYRIETFLGQGIGKKKHS